MRVDNPYTLQWRYITGLDDALKAAVADGLSASEVASRLSEQFRRLKITRCMCIGRAKRMGLRWARGKHGKHQKVTL